MGDAGFARVLESSPPAVSDGRWFAAATNQRAAGVDFFPARHSLLLEP
jgi:hypothetical protein